MDIELTILGSGTSAGVPIIGCDCETCCSDDPRDRRLRTSAFLRLRRGDEERIILIDTSPDLREQALRHRLKRCDAILYTHNHVDHTFGLDEVRRFNAIMRSPIDLYADGHTLDHLHRVYRHIFERDRNVNDSFVATLIAHEIAIERPIMPLPGFNLRAVPIALLHGNLPVLGYRFDLVDDDGEPCAEQPGPLPLAYCTDVSAIPPRTWSRLTGLRTLILDALRFRSHPTHFTVDEAVSAAERIGADRTWLIHMTHDIRHAELDPRLPDGVALAFDGLVVGAGGEAIDAPRTTSVRQ